MSSDLGTDRFEPLKAMPSRPSLVRSSPTQRYHRRWNRLEQLLGEERDARELLSVPSAVLPENAEQSFKAAIDRSIAARHQIQLFDLEVEVHLVDLNLRYAAAPQYSPRAEIHSEFEHLYDLRHQVDLARADRELDLRFSTRGIETPDYRAEQELRAEIADLLRYFEEAARRGGPASLPLSISSARSLERWEVRAVRA